MGKVYCVLWFKVQSTMVTSPRQELEEAAQIETTVRKKICEYMIFLTSILHVHSPGSQPENDISSIRMVFHL